MTVSEIDLILTAAKDIKPEGFTPIAPTDMNAWVERRRRMTFEEQLKEARDE